LAHQGEPQVLHRAEPHRAPKRGRPAVQGLARPNSSGQPLSARTSGQWLRQPSPLESKVIVELPSVPQRVPSAPDSAEAAQHAQPECLPARLHEESAHSLRAAAVPAGLSEPEPRAGPLRERQSVPASPQPTLPRQPTQKLEPGAAREKSGGRGKPVEQRARPEPRARRFVEPGPQPRAHAASCRGPRQPMRLGRCRERR
jgi:hypothetical protein